MCQYKPAMVSSNRGIKTTRCQSRETPFFIRADIPIALQRLYNGCNSTENTANGLRCCFMPEGKYICEVFQQFSMVLSSLCQTAILFEA